MGGHNHHTMSCCRLPLFVAIRSCRLVVLLAFAAFEMICNKSVCHCPLATPHCQITCHFNSCPLVWLSLVLLSLVFALLVQLICPLQHGLASSLSLPLLRNCLLFTLFSSLASPHTPWLLAFTHLSGAPGGSKVWPGILKVNTCGLKLTLTDLLKTLWKKIYTNYYYCALYTINIPFAIWQRTACIEKLPQQKSAPEMPKTQ